MTPFPADLEKCQEILHLLSGRVISIERQLNVAKATAASTGEYADRGWFIRTNDALKYNRREVQRLTEHMGALRTKERRKHSMSFSAILIEVLKEQVSRQVFDACILEAKHRAEKYQSAPTEGETP